MAYNTKVIVQDAAGNHIPQFYNPKTDAYEPSEGENGAVKVIVGGFGSHVSVEGNATTTEESVAFDVTYVHTISNDGTDDIKINFDADTTQPGVITLKAGEVLEDFPRKCSTLYYKAASGTQPFRAWGVK